MSAQDQRESAPAWLEPVIIVVMALTTLTTAWCSYQSSEWSGNSTDDAGQADRLERQANALHAEGNQAMTSQAIMFMNMMGAHLTGNEEIVRFYEARLPKEFRPAYEAWLAQKPYENPKAAPHPFVPQLYQPRFTQEVKQALTDSAAHRDQARKEGSIAASYLANTVLFATVLFFAGTASKFDHVVIRKAAIFFAIAVLVFAAIRTAFLPVA